MIDGKNGIQINTGNTNFSVMGLCKSLGQVMQVEAKALEKGQKKALIYVHLSKGKKGQSQGTAPTSATEWWWLEAGQENTQRFSRVTENNALNLTCKYTNKCWLINLEGTSPF